MIHILPRYTLFPYTDALPIYADTTPGIDEMRGVARRHLRYAARRIVAQWSLQRSGVRDSQGRGSVPGAAVVRSEEHTSELQSPYDIVCRLLLEKKKITI